MKNSTTKWKLWLLCLLLPSCMMMAQQATHEKRIASQEMKIAKERVCVKTESLKPESNVLRKINARTKVTDQTPLTMNDLVGSWLAQSPSLVPTTLPDVFNVVTIVKVDEQTILLKDFWGIGVSLKATVDFQKGIISIPHQKAFTHQSYGDCDIRWITVVGNGIQGSSTKPITGTISAQGIQITDYWGMFITSGPNADEAFGIYGGTTMEKSNAVMSTDELDGVTHFEYPVVVKQKSDNLLTVYNFADFGKTIEILLDEERNISIASQLAASNNQYGDFYTYSANFQTSTISPLILGTGDEHTLNWGAWIIQSEKAAYGKHLNGKIVTNLTIKYPKLVVSEFEGDGTEAKPYLIKSINELILLARKVNTDKELNYGGANKHTKSFLGKYFKIANDIDASSLRLDPIGNKWSQCFAGTFDGDGKTIKGLDVSTVDGMAGLFGRTDTAAIIKNVKLEDVTIHSNGSWCGGIAGWCLGSIQNCHVTGTVKNEAKMTGGVAGRVTNLTGCTFSGTVAGMNGCVGGIAGQVEGAITNSFSDAIVFAASNSAAAESCGGVMGALYKDASATNCYFAGTVISSGPSPLYTGGIVGDCYKGNISQCYNVGEVSGSGAQGAIGGIAGYLIGTLTNCYNSGRVSQSACRTAGGIVGGISDNRDIMTGALIAHSVVRNCYTVGTVIAEISAYKPETETRETIGTIQSTATPVIENVYYDKQMIDFGSKKYGVVTDELTSATGPAGFSADAWIFAKGFYPRLKGLDKGAIADLSVSAIHLDKTIPDNIYKITKDFTLSLAGSSLAGFYLDNGYGQGALHDKGHAASLQNAMTVQLTGDGKDTLFIANGTYSRSYIITVTSPSIFEGEGTKGNPFLIKTKADLIKLSELTGPEVKQVYRDTYFKMTSDIDLEYDEAFKGINVDPKDANHQFHGHFDGGGFTIHRMKMNGVAWKIKPEDAPDGLGTPDNTGSTNYLGFIGRLGAEGSLRNLNIASDCVLEFWAQSAAFVSSNYGGLIENCRNYADIIAYSGNVGGICSNNQSLGEGTIRNCYNAGTIRIGYNCVAGIVGTNAGTVENCQNDGTIIVEKLSTFMPTAARAVAGGIVGAFNASGTIALRNNVNTGMIQAEKRVGGICGFASLSGSKGNVTMANNINYGTLVTEDIVSRGAFCGEFSATCQHRFIDNYYDGQILPYGALNNVPREGVNKVATSVLTKGSLNNFSSEIWEMSENQYPVLKIFANEEKSRMASQIILKMADSENVGDLKTNIALQAPKEIVWSLKQGTAFTLNGSTVQVPESVKEVTCDTLVAASPGFTKLIFLTRLPAIPLTGQGTKEAPYLITNAEDWNALAEYIPATYQTFEGKYLQITKDIDFKDKEFVPIAGDGITSFEGKMDGNKKTISNIDFNFTGTEYVGLFGRIGSKGCVSNLTIGTGSFVLAKGHVGGFAGKLAGTLENCVNRATVSTTSNYAGGMTSLAEATAKLINCINYGEINGKTGYAAGISAECQAGASFVACGNEGKLIGSTIVAGIVAKAAGAVLDQCYNKGAIEATGATIGGVIATTSGADTLFIRNCYNTVGIKATNSAAGIVAASKTTPCYIENCYNLGDVTTTATGTSVGTAGIIGTIAPATYVGNSHNSGNITSEKCANIGGIIGFAPSSNKEETPIIVTKSYNEGTISALSNNAGGICGSTSVFMTIDSCYNIGSVEATYYVGGISANLAGISTAILNSWNAGSVTAQKNAAGGLFGTGNFAALITNCFNIATVSSTGADEKASYQIGGLAGMSKAIFTNCYNSGRVDGKKQIGGLVGQAFSGSINKTTEVITYGTCFYNCYNAGEVTKLDTLSGNFVGDVNGKTWAFNVSEELYALNTQPMKGDTIGTLISHVDLCKQNMGKGWTKGDDYTYPILENCNNDPARVMAAMVVLSGQDSFERVTENFHIGTPERVVWSSSSTSLTVNGNEVSVKGNCKEEVVLTVAIGDFSKDFILKLDTPTGINETTSDGKVIVCKEYYSISGIRLVNEQMEAGNIYVVVRTYDDGTTEKVKEMY